MKRRRFIKQSSQAAVSLAVINPLMVQPLPNPAIFKWLIELGKAIGTTILESSVATYIENKWFKDDVEDQGRQIGTQYQIGTLHYHHQPIYIVQYRGESQQFFFPMVPSEKDRSYEKQAWLPCFNYNSSYHGLSKVLNYPATVGLSTAARDLSENEHYSGARLAKMLLPFGRQAYRYVEEKAGGGICMFDTYGGTVAIHYEAIGKDQFRGRLEFSGHVGMGFRKEYLLEGWED